MKKRRMAGWMLLAASVLLLTGCGNSFEGSGSKEAASADQLALRLEDPWKKTPEVKRECLDGDYRDGTYTGTGQGMEGWIRVTISIQDRVLHVISVQQEGETQSVGGYEAIRDGVFAAQIEAAQGDDIEGVSGATITANGVRAALKDALSQAWDGPETMSAEDLKDGTYTGKGRGMGDIRVTISVTDGKLSVLSVEQSGETKGVGGYEAIEDGTFARQIEEAQGTGIDGVAGATLTSQGVISALEDAMSQALK